jgi:hypothetical protein
MIHKTFQIGLWLFLSSLLAAQQAQVDNPQHPSSPSSVTPEVITIPKDTKIELMTLESVSSETAHKGSAVRFVVANDVVVNGNTVLYAGAPVTGIVTKAKRGIAFHQWAGLTIRVKQMRIGNGPALRLTASDPAIREKPGEFARDYGWCLLIVPGCIALEILVLNGCGEDSCPGKPKADGEQQAILPSCVTLEYWTKSSFSVSSAALVEEMAAASAYSSASCPQILGWDKVFGQPGVRFVELK